MDTPFASDLPAGLPGAVDARQSERPASLARAQSMLFDTCFMCLLVVHLSGLHRMLSCSVRLSECARARTLALSPSLSLSARYDAVDLAEAAVAAAPVPIVLLCNLPLPLLFAVLEQDGNQLVVVLSRRLVLTRRGEREGLLVVPAGSGGMGRGRHGGCGGTKAWAGGKGRLVAAGRGPASRCLRGGGGGGGGGWRVGLEPKFLCTKNGLNQYFVL